MGVHDAALSPDLIADLLLRFHREPARYREQMLKVEQIFGDLDVVCKLALGHVFKFFDPALVVAQSDGKLEEQLRYAALFYIQTMFFRPNATHYQILGVRQDALSETIRAHFRMLMQLIHPDRQDPQSPWPESCAARVNTAYAVLKNPAIRVEYDKQLLAVALGMPLASISIEEPKEIPRRSFFPRWLAVPVARFAHAYPSITAFFGVVAVSAVAISALVLNEREETLMRDTGALSTSSTSESGQPELGKVPNSEIVAVTAHTISAKQVHSTRQKPDTDADGATGFLIKRAHAGNLTTNVVLVQLRMTPWLAAAPIVEKPANQPRGDVLGMLPSKSKLATSASPGQGDIEGFMADFISAYESGTLDAFTDMFAIDAETNFRHGRASIRREYEELFRLSTWRRMSVADFRWLPAGQYAEASGNLTVRVRWTDGREVEQQIAITIDFVKREGRTMIARLMHHVYQ